MEYQLIIEGVQNLSGAQVWLSVAVLVFAICAILMMLTFRQFSQHQDDLSETETEEKEKQAILFDMRHVTAQERYTLSTKPLMIGRVAVKDSEHFDSLVISDVTVGRRHAVIEKDDEGYWLEDQGSVNGSFVNGQRIDERRRLRDGDYVKIHKFSFQFVEHYHHQSEQSLGEEPGDITMPQILHHEISAPKPNEVLIEHAQQDKEILHIPRTARVVEDDPFRTQVLSRTNVQAEMPKSDVLEKNLPAVPAQRQIEDLNDMTLQLFQSPKDDKTMRLYSDLLAGPPKDRPVYKEVEKTTFAKSVLLPDMDEKVIEALGDFFSENNDDPVAPLEMTDKNAELTRIGRFAPVKIKKPV